jgi:hypothetical protein
MTQIRHQNFQTTAYSATDLHRRPQTGEIFLSVKRLCKSVAKNRRWICDEKGALKNFLFSI